MNHLQSPTTPTRQSVVGNNSENPCRTMRSPASSTVMPATLSCGKEYYWRLKRTAYSHLWYYVLASMNFLLSFYATRADRACLTFNLVIPLGHSRKVFPLTLSILDLYATISMANCLAWSKFFDQSFHSQGSVVHSIFPPHFSPTCPSDASKRWAM